MSGQKDLKSRCQSDRVNVRDPIGVKIPKMWVITVESPYHAQLWEYLPLDVNYPKLLHKALFGRKPKYFLFLPGNG